MQIRNEDIRTELEYFSVDFDEEREMEPRPIRIRETTLVLCARSSRARRQRERVVSFEDVPNRDGGRVERNSKGRRPSGLGVDNNRSQGMNLPPLLTAHLGRSENDPVIIKARISRRQVNRVYINSRSSCEVIYKHCFLKLKPSIRSLQIDSKTPLVGFSVEHSWPPGEVPLEITISGSPYARTEILNFVIVRSISPHNLLHRRTAMQRMSIVVSTIHGAIKFHTPRGIGTVFSTRKFDKAREEQKKLKGTSPKTPKGILSCAVAKERIIVKKKYPEQTIIKGKQLPTSFKMKLQGLLRANADIFAWTYTHMTGILKTVMMGGKPFNTEHRLNEFKYIEPVKQKKRSLAPEKNEAMRKKLEELTKANILREVKY
ncbi:hypothetical protein Tco_1564210 [Tanacetum coccineum]